MKLVRFVLLMSFALFVALLVGQNGIRLSADNDQTKDREAIEALMWKYARALDTFNADAYVACYTPDGEFRAGPTPTKGADALRKMIVDLKKNREEREAKGEAQPPMFHMEMNKYVEFPTKDTARHHTYWETVFGAAGRGGQVRVAAAGNAVDDLVKVNGKWLIKVRNVSPGTSD